MKKTIQLTLLLLLLVSTIGCSTGYWVDRGRDAADIFTATVGMGVGAKARVGPVQAGLVCHADVAGIRNGGTFFNMESPRIDFCRPAPYVSHLVWDINLLFCGVEVSNTSVLIARRHKEYNTLNLIVPIGIVEPRTSQLTTHYYTQLEAVLGLGPSFRLGFNPGELFDFILGWATIDIFDDDLEARTRKEEESNQRMQATPNSRA